MLWIEQYIRIRWRKEFISLCSPLHQYTYMLKANLINFRHIARPLELLTIWIISFLACSPSKSIEVRKYCQKILRHITRSGLSRCGGAEKNVKCTEQQCQMGYISRSHYTPRAIDERNSGISITAQFMPAVNRSVGRYLHRRGKEKEMGNPRRKPKKYKISAAQTYTQI